MVDWKYSARNDISSHCGGGNPSFTRDYSVGSGGEVSKIDLVLIKKIMEVLIEGGRPPGNKRKGSQAKRNVKDVLFWGLLSSASPEVLRDPHGPSRSCPYGGGLGQDAREA